MPKIVVFRTTSTIKDEKSAAKFHYIKTVGGRVVAQSIAFQVVWIYWQGVAPFPWYLNTKGPTPIGSTCVAHTLPHGTAAVRNIEKKFNYSKHAVENRLCKSPTSPLSPASNWWRAVLSADAGLLVSFLCYVILFFRPHCNTTVFSGLQVAPEYKPHLPIFA